MSRLPDRFLRVSRFVRLGGTFFKGEVEQEPDVGTYVRTGFNLRGATGGIAF
jgi:hypothetical protein